MLGEVCQRAIGFFALTLGTFVRSHLLVVIRTWRWEWFAKVVVRVQSGDVF